MFTKPNNMQLATWLIAVGLTVSTAVAQQATVTTDNSNGVQTTKFATLSGTVTVFTPKFIEAGDRISGTVIEDPKGKTDKEKKTNQATLEGMVIEVMGEKVKPSQRMIHFTVPAGLVLISILDSHGKTVSKCPIKTLPQGSIAPETKTIIPPIMIAGQPLIIRGSFDGDASNTKCSIGGVPAEVLAQSPREAIVFSQTSETGPQNVKIEEQGTTTTGTIHLVKLNLSAPKTNLLKGESTTITVKVSGLEGITKDVPMSMTNESPKTVQMTGGNTIVRSIHPNNVSQTGEFSIETQLTASSAGSFVISAQVGQPNNWWIIDPDNPLAMEDYDRLIELDRVSNRQLLDTLKDLRYRKMFDYLNSKESQKWLAKKIRLIKDALNQRRIPYKNLAIDEADF
ncbi:MAG: hypothetical protein WCG75_02240 [Armatimonadota bacterium]